MGGMIDMKNLIYSIGVCVFANNAKGRIRLRPGEFYCSVKSMGLIRIVNTKKHQIFLEEF